MTKRNQQTLGLYQNMPPQKRRAFRREDKKALAEITKRLRRFGFSDCSKHHGYYLQAPQSGFEPIGIFAKSKNIADSERYKDYTNAKVRHIIYIHRNWQKQRTHRFFDDQIKFQKSFFPYKEIMIRGGILIDYYYQIVASDDKVTKGHAQIRNDQMINLDLSDFMPNISGATRKGRPIRNIVPDPRHYFDCITSASQLHVFLKTPIRPNALEHIPARSPRNMESKLY